MLVSNGFYQRLIIGSSGEEFRVFPSINVPASSKLTTKPRMVRNVVYLVVIGWLYVVLMMAVAEASNTTGTVLGAIVTFFLYGLIPIALVVYLMRTPQRRKEIKAREAAENAAGPQAHSTEQEDRFAARPPQGESAPSVGSDPRSGGAWGPSDPPDAGGHAPGAAQTDSVPAVGKET
ncbi:MAG: hypothetical protein U1C47_00540 [Hydrogenophaga sp.]|jgi:hypothetical protein|uniref:hypothetical protein n=1 Tax=Hydrogenophaga sp. TaxID=1904254 RepID=UPI002ABA418C|nr:hypothetical protein [Hydrogenophaga sp.]